MNWNLAQVEPNCERRAVRHAPFYHVETFLPEVLQEVKVRRQRLMRKVLMFPGYVFVRFEELNNWHRAKRHGRVFTKLLLCDGKFGDPTGNEVVAGLQALMEDGVVPAPDYQPQFHSGQRVRVARGRYADLFGSVEGAAEARVTVLLSFFNRPLSVSLDEGLVVAA